MKKFEALFLLIATKIQIILDMKQKQHRATASKI